MRAMSAPSCGTSPVEHDQRPDDQEGAHRRGPAAVHGPGRGEQCRTGVDHATVTGIRVHEASRMQDSAHRDAHGEQAARGLIGIRADTREAAQHRRRRHW